MTDARVAVASAPVWFRRLLTKGVGGSAGLRLVGWRETRSRLFDLELGAEMAEVRERLGDARVRTRRHDEINALAAVEGAYLIMTRETLSASDQFTLEGLLENGLSRLRSLLLDEAEVESVALAELTNSLAAELGWHGRVLVDVATDLVVAGMRDEVAEVVRRLVTHCSRREPSGVVTVRARRQGDRVRLQIDDRGPRLSNRELRQVNRPDRRRSFGVAGVSELDVAICIVRQQAGDVTVEARHGGGVSWRVCWPAQDG